MTWSKQHYRVNSGHRPDAVELEVKSAILLPCIQKILCLALLGKEEDGSGDVESGGFIGGTSKALRGEQRSQAWAWCR